MKQLVASYIRGYQVELRPIEPRDLPTLRRWRNSDRVRLNMLDQSLITPHAQRQWYERICANKGQRHWLVEVDGVRAGYANLKGLQPGKLAEQAEADGGMYLGDSSVRHGLLGVAVALCQLDAAFDHLHIERLKTQVKCDNHSALRLNQVLGYKEVSHNAQWKTLTLDAADYYVARSSLMRFFRHV